MGNLYQSPIFLAVNEIFGKTFQGEGRNIGMPCMFLRLAGCNLACSWCDTRYAWDWSMYDVKKELHKMTIQDVADQLLNQPVKSLVISGGEPMLQQRSLNVLIDLLRMHGWWIEIETAGTIAPHPANNADQFTVSLKLTNSGNPIFKRRRDDAIQAFATDYRSIFKFVVSDKNDFREIDELVMIFHLPNEQIYIMPEGITDDVIQSRMETIAEEALNRNFHLTTRLQVLLYGSKRGV